jgi:hypothetical protein
MERTKGDAFMSPKPIAEVGWIDMFDGKTLNGWQALVNPQIWSV